MPFSRASNARRYTITTEAGCRLVQFADIRPDWFGEIIGQATVDRIHGLDVGESMLGNDGETIKRMPDPELKELQRVKTSGSCGCCGASGRASEILKGGVQDVDGTYYARLCGSCFDDFEDAAEFDRPRSAELSALTALLGDDTDGIESSIQDLSFTKTPARGASYAL